MMAAQMILADGKGKIRPKNLAVDFADMVPSQALQQKDRGDRQSKGLFVEVEANTMSRNAEPSTRSLRSRKCQSMQAASRAEEHDTRRRTAALRRQLSAALPSQEGAEKHGEKGKQERAITGKPPRSPVRQASLGVAANTDKWQAETEGKSEGQKKHKGIDSHNQGRKPEIDSEDDEDLPSVERRIQSVVKWERAVKEVLGAEEWGARRANKRASDEGLKQEREGKRARMCAKLSGGKVACRHPGMQVRQAAESESQAGQDQADAAPRGALILARGPDELQFHPGLSPPTRVSGFRPESAALAVYPKIRPSRAALFSGGDGKEWVRRSDDCTVQATAPEGTEAYKRQKKNMTFGGFTRVFGPATTQEDFFRRTTADPVEAFVTKRKSCVVWAFGMTAAGKSHTMIGNEAQPGLIPRAMDLIFALVAQLGCTLPVSFSVIENQSDKFFDLLATPKFEHNKRSGWLEFNPGSGNVKGATEVVLQSAEQGKAALQRALANRQTERTDLNAASSRSHAVFMLQLGDPRTMDADARARLCFVDLAGSERLGRTHNEGARLTESKWINATLTSIFTCIKVTADNQEAVRRNARAPLDLVPWRNSKISNMFREELQGRGNMILAMCLSPDRDDFDETIYQLERAKEAAKIRILCHVEAPQQPWSIIKAPRATPAVRLDQEGIGRLWLLEEENEQLRFQLTSMSATLAGDDERVGALEAENERLRQQMTSLSEMLREAEAAKLHLAEQTEMTVRREVVAEFDAALVQRKAAEADRLERALQFERRKFERRLTSARARASQVSEAGQTERLSLTPTKSVDDEPEVSRKLEGRVSDATKPVERESCESEALEGDWISGANFDFEGERTVSRVRRSSETSEKTQPLAESAGASHGKLADLVAWQEKCRQLEETIEALELVRSTAAIDQRNAEAAISKNTALERKVALLSERLKGALSRPSRDDDTCTAEKEEEKQKKIEDEMKLEAEVARKREGQLSAELLEARNTIAALQEQIAHLAYAMEQHGVLMAEVRREERAKAEERAAEVVKEYERDLLKALEEERSQAETDAHSLRMQIEMLEDQLDRQREETDKLNGLYQALLSRVQSSPPKLPNPKPFVGFGFALGATRSPTRPLQSQKAPSHSFSSPMGRAISAAVNRPRVLEDSVHTELPTEPVGLRLLVDNQECEYAGNVEGPAEGSMPKRPFTLLQKSPTSVVRRSPSFAFLAGNRGSLPTPRASSHRRFVSEMSLKEEEEGSPAYRAAGRNVTSSTEERMRTRVSFDFKVPGDSSRMAHKFEKQSNGGSVERHVPVDEPLEQLRGGPRGTFLLADSENKLAREEESKEPGSRGAIDNEKEGMCPSLQDDFANLNPDPMGFSPNSSPFSANLSPNPSNPRADPDSPKPPVSSPEQAFFAPSLLATNPQENTSLAEPESIKGKECSRDELETGCVTEVVKELAGTQIQPKEVTIEALQVRVSERGQEKRVSVTEPLSRFQRGKLRAAELFVPLRPVTVQNVVKGPQPDPVKEEVVRLESGLGRGGEPGPVGVLLQETLRLPMPVLTSAISGSDDGRVLSLVSEHGGSLDVEHFERRGKLRLSKDKKLCMRYCFALLSERWRDPSSDVLFPLEKRKGAELERAKIFSAIWSAQTVKEAATRAREGLRVEGLSRGLVISSGKENADPSEERRVGGRVRKGRVGKPSPRLTRSSKATSVGRRGERVSPNNEALDEELSQREALGTPYAYSGFKKIVPIWSVYQRELPKWDERVSCRRQEDEKRVSVDLNEEVLNEEERLSSRMQREENGLAQRVSIVLNDGESTETGSESELEGRTKPEKEATDTEEEGFGGGARPKSAAGIGAEGTGVSLGGSHEEPKVVNANAKRKRPRLQPMQRVIDLEEALGETDGSPMKETQQKRTRRLLTRVARRTRGTLCFLV